MKKHRLKKSVSIFAMLAAAVVLLIYSSVGGTRAVLTYYSQRYDSKLMMQDIGITLLENGKDVHHRIYTEDGLDESKPSELLSHIEKFEFGQTYEEKLAVQNSGRIPEYVRLTIRTYWEDTTGKRVDLDPSLIKIKLDTTTGWKVDPQYSNSETEPERTVLYYTKPLEPNAKTPDATKWITVDSAVKAVVDKTEKKEDPTTHVITVITTYTYNGLNFVLEAEADGVQTHNAEDAIKSAWGRDVTIGEDGTLSLN